MYQNKRNLFPFFAVLVSAGIITSLYGIIFFAADRIGGKPLLVLNATDQKATNDSSSNPLLSNSLLVASGSYNSKVRLWDVSKGLNPSILTSTSADKSADELAQVQTLAHHGRVNDLAFIAGESSSQASQSKETK